MNWFTRLFSWQRLTDEQLIAKAARWRYAGLHGLEPNSWPKARVTYKTGESSYAMALGNAVDLAATFGGTVRIVRPS